MREDLTHLIDSPSGSIGGARKRPWGNRQNWEHGSLEANQA